jgi:hypothetical protein
MDFIRFFIFPFCMMFFSFFDHCMVCMSVHTHTQSRFLRSHNPCKSYLLFILPKMFQSGKVTLYHIYIYI